MRDLPRPPVEPLSPPPGTFDAVLGHARYRRHRRAGAALSVTAVFLAGIVGGVSLDGGVSGVRQTIIGLATFPEDEVPPTEEPTTSAAVTPDVDQTPKPVATPRPHRAPRSKRPGASAVQVAPPAPPAPQVVTGVALDVTGGPIAGLYVYPGQPGQDRFLATREPATRTAADGTFSLPCPGTAVLLSPWRVNVAEGPEELRAAWAATFIGGGTEASSAPDAPCGSGAKVVSTTVLPGSTLDGTVTMPAECADTQFPLWLWLNDDRSLTVRMRGLTSGDSFSVGGLPPGQHIVGANGDRTPVTVGGGGTFTQDVTFSCVPGSPPPTPEPAPTGPTPSPTPSEPPAPAPTGGTPTGGSSTGSTLSGSTPTGSTPTGTTPTGTAPSSSPAPTQTGPAAGPR